MPLGSTPSLDAAAEGYAPTTFGQSDRKPLRPAPAPDQDLRARTTVTTIRQSRSATPHFHNNTPLLHVRASSAHRQPPATTLK